MSFSALFIAEPWLFATVLFVCGLLVGSFLNVVIYRLPKMLERDWQAQCAELRGETLPPQPKFNLCVPHSACPNCGHKIGPLENIPVLSWLFLRGKCKGCGQPISPRYPLVELAAGLLAALAGWHFGFGWQAAGAVLLLWTLLALAFIDFDTQLLPDDLTLPLLWLGLLFNLQNAFASSLSSAVIGAVAGYLVLWLVYWSFKLLTGKEGMGYGDFKLLAALGAWLGWEMLPAIILLSDLAGSLIGIGLIVLAKRGKNIPIPFGPYLAIAGGIALFLGHRLNLLF
ncbi:MAG: A24 family peptidase [Zoogloeaceae bacterium]|jgi:leader peptidase (prepilin peptidase)/N-methyltransferase|nr:A24 family peptidase [Zoogloeaceae bacterium]